MKTHKTIYRTFESSPINEIRELKAACFPHLYLETEEERMNDYMSNHLVVRVYGRVIGYARLRYAINQSKHLYIDRVCVHPDFRGNGIFADMMAFIERKYRNACLRLKARYHLAPAYKKLGYFPVAKDQAFEYLQKM